VGSDVWRHEHRYDRVRVLGLLVGSAVEGDSGERRCDEAVMVPSWQTVDGVEGGRGRTHDEEDWWARGVERRRRPEVEEAA
jgi:hypothetical protein